MASYTQHPANLISSSSIGGAKKEFSIKKTRNPAQGGSGQLFTQGSNPSEIQHFGTDHGKSMSNLIGQSYQQIGPAAFGNSSMQ